VSYRLRCTVNIDWVSHGTGQMDNVLQTVQFNPVRPVVITGSNHLSAHDLLSSLVNTAVDIYEQASVPKTLQRIQEFPNGGR